MTKFKNGEDFYHLIYQRFNALIAIPLLPFGYMLVRKLEGSLHNVVENNWLYWMLSVVILLTASVVMWVSTLQYRSRLVDIDPDLPLRDKLLMYLSISTKKYLSFAVVGGILAAAYFLLVNEIILVLYVVSLILLSLDRPTLTQFIEDLKLNEKDSNVLIEKLPL